MHEFSLVHSTLEIALRAAQENNAIRITSITIEVGELIEASEELLHFAFDALSEDTIAEGAEFCVDMIPVASKCNECNKEFEHSRFQVKCPYCGSINCTFIHGRELQVASLEVDAPE